MPMTSMSCTGISKAWARSSAPRFRPTVPPVRCPNSACGGSKAAVPRDAMRPREDIDRLRAALAKAGLETGDRRQRMPLGHPAADRALKGGLARGALHEIFAHPGHETAATGFAVAACARLAASKPILWIRQDYCALE